MILSVVLVAEVVVMVVVGPRMEVLVVLVLEVGVEEGRRGRWRGVGSSGE